MSECGDGKSYSPDAFAMGASKFPDYAALGTSGKGMG